MEHSFETLRIWKDLNEVERQNLLLRPVQSNGPALAQSVSSIIEETRKLGDQALFGFAKKFDQVELFSTVVAQEELQKAYEELDEETLAALKQAKSNIETFHALQVAKDYQVETMPGVMCERQTRPVEKVGLYVPGGSAPLVSAVLMLAIPANIAGCSTRVLATPPSRDGRIPTVILAAAYLCKVTHVVCSGGAQAIAALAFGTESVPKVDKIFGPGNSWVTEAKQQVSLLPGGASFDSPAGPSEVLVIVDKDSDAGFAAADLLSQAEHGPDSQVVLISTDAEKAKEVLRSVKVQLQELPRKEIAAKALKSSFVILAEDLVDAINISNIYAPEHLIVHPDLSKPQLEMVKNAGSVFLGPYTPESVGDYASGTNHVLPTYGHAKTYSGLSVDDFRKQITFQRLTQAGLKSLAPTVEKLADLEGLCAHKNAVVLRRLVPSSNQS